MGSGAEDPRVAAVSAAAAAGEAEAASTKDLRIRSWVRTTFSPSLSSRASRPVGGRVERCPAHSRPSKLLVYPRLERRCSCEVCPALSSLSPPLTSAPPD